MTVKEGLMSYDPLQKPESYGLDPFMKVKEAAAKKTKQVLSVEVNSNACLNLTGKSHRSQNS